MKQTVPPCLQVGQPFEEQPSEEQQATDVAVVVHKAAGPGTAPDSALSCAGVADALSAERQAAGLHAEQELAALQATFRRRRAPAS